MRLGVVGVGRRWPVRREWLLAVPSAAGDVGLWLLAAAADLQWLAPGAGLRGMDPSATSFRLFEFPGCG
jgi:hypothetical protein